MCWRNFSSYLDGQLKPGQSQASTQGIHYCFTLVRPRCVMTALYRFQDMSPVTRWHRPTTRSIELTDSGTDMGDRWRWATVIHWQTDWQTFEMPHQPDLYDLIRERRRRVLPHVTKPIYDISKNSLQALSLNYILHTRRSEVNWLPANFRRSAHDYNKIIGGNQVGSTSFETASWYFDAFCLNCFYQREINYRLHCGS